MIPEQRRITDWVWWSEWGKGVVFIRWHFADHFSEKKGTLRTSKWVEEGHHVTSVVKSDAWLGKEDVQRALERSTHLWHTWKVWLPEYTCFRRAWSWWRQGMHERAGAGRPRKLGKDFVIKFQNENMPQKCGKQRMTFRLQFPKDHVGCSI